MVIRMIDLSVYDESIWEILVDIEHTTDAEIEFDDTDIARITVEERFITYVDSFFYPL